MRPPGKHARSGADARGQDGEVVVWQARLDGHALEFVESMRRLLSADELERSQRFFFERDRRRFVVGRGILRTLLADELGSAPERLEFVYGENGKPSLRTNAGAAPLCFNVAHSGDLAVYAVTRVGEIGIDVEKIRPMPDWEQVARMSFSARELARVKACEPARRNEEFFHAWARQEAVLKALGTGLGAAGIDAETEAGFIVHPLPVEDGYAAALAVSPAVRRPPPVYRWSETCWRTAPATRRGSETFQEQESEFTTERTLS